MFGGIILNGINSNNLYGSSVSSAGDINGDGIDDLLVGARGSGAYGEAYIVFGRTDFNALELSPSDLDGTNGFQIVSSSEVGDLGYSVSGLGDVNEDGLDDIIIGTSDFSGDNIGIFVVFGRDGGGDFGAELDVSTLASSEGFGVLGSTELGYYFNGYEPIDFNSDGINDIPLRSSFAGFVLQGGGGLLFNDDSNVDLRNQSDGSLFQLSLGFDFTQKKETISGAGDVNGDGIEDLIVGFERGGEYDIYSSGPTGSAFVVFGSGNVFSNDTSDDLIDGSNGFEIVGIDDNDDAGTAVSAAGDVNGDGFDDVVVGSRFHDALNRTNAGAAFVIFGKNESFESAIEAETLDGSNGFKISGSVNFERIGESLSSIEDINGDGLGEILIGTGAEYSYLNQFTPRMYVIFGVDDASVSEIDLASFNKNMGYQIVGTSGGSQSSAFNRVSSAGDLNDDGFEDIIIGSERTGGNQSGQVYVLFGGKTRLTALDRADGEVDGVISLGNLSEVTFGTVGADTIKSTPNGDDYYGLEGADSLFGGNGDDRLFGGDGTDDLGSGNGADLLAGGRGNDNLRGGQQDDVLYGNKNDDFLQGGPGADLLFGGEGNDRLTGDAGSDLINGGDGIDTVDFSITGATAITVDLSKTAAQDTGQGLDTLLNIEHVTGSEFDDQIIGNSVANDLFGGDGKDSLFGGSQIDELFGGSGGDTLEGGTYRDMLYGGAGFDTLYGGGGDDDLYGGFSNDTLDGGGGDDRLYGGGGVDTAVFLGSGGVVVDLEIAGPQDTGRGIDTFVNIDNLVGSDGDDTLKGTSNPNQLTGGEGQDFLSGRKGSDDLRGESGNDTIFGGKGSDIISGGGGNDRVLGDRGKDIISGGRFGDDLFGGGGEDEIRGDRGSDRIQGGQDNDKLFGGSGNDEMFGDSGDDAMRGGRGQDVINGGDGNDILWAGSALGDQPDELSGGIGGIDKFVFRQGDGRIEISDFGIDDRLSFVDFNISRPEIIEILRSGQLEEENATVFELGGDYIKLEGVGTSSIINSQIISNETIDSIFA